MATGFYLLDNEQPNTQQWGYPRRGATLSGTCIVHTAECAADIEGPDGAAEGTAHFINGRSDYGSYHTLVDSDSIIEMVPYEYEAWQDSQTNPWAVGISAAVQADLWHAIPADRKDRIYRNLAWAAADFVSYMATKGITVPLRRITGQQARDRVPGFCAHGDSGIDRHDPGTEFDWALFFKYTAAQLAGNGGTPASGGLQTQGADVTQIPKEVVEMPKYSRVTESATGKKPRRLVKGTPANLMADASNSRAQNFAVNGLGFYDVDLFLQGHGLPAGETVTVKFSIVKQGKASGYFPVEIHGTTDGLWSGHARFKMPILDPALLQASLLSTVDTAYLDNYGAEVYTYPQQ